MIVPVQPQSRAVPMARAARLAAPRAEAALPPRSLRGGDHRRGNRRADGRGQRVQAPHQQRFPLDLGVPEPRALLVVTVDPFLHRVDVNEGQGFRSGQQRRLPGQVRQEFPARLLQLGDVSPGIGAQVRAQRGRRADAAEQGVSSRRAAAGPCHRSNPPPAAMPATRHGTFTAALHAARAARPDVLRDQARPARRAGPGPSPAPGRRATRDSGRRRMRASWRGYATIAFTRCPLG